MSIALRVAPLIFVAAVLQVGAVAGSRVLGAEPDLLLVTVVVVALVAGSITGAVAGFAGGLLVDVMTLDTLGTTSIVFTVAGYWAGRYGETTGRGRPYAAPLSAFAITLLATPANVALHFLLGQPVSARAAFATLIPTAIVNGLLAFGLHPLLRRYLARADRLPPRPREVGLV
ncbi:MAG TPA: rod shape-determining protein MreD [Gaiella sp.]|jgi:rod shape-determining protein MreD|nr:rod shape-determining protein MreD [Gaiella sp.]